MKVTAKLGVKAVTIILATTAIYFQDLAIVANEAIRSELMSHILAIPLLLIYIVYRKRKMLRATIPFETSNPIQKPTYTYEIVGALLCLLAFLLYWHGSYTFHPLEYHMVSLPLFVAGCILILLNTETLKVLAFPIAFLLFLTPPPLEILHAAGTILSSLSSEAAYQSLKAIGLPVTLATQYGTPIITLTKPDTAPLAFAIDIACAGIYSLMGFTIFATFVAYIARGAAWKKATIFLTGFPLIYVMNIIRIVIIVLIGYQYGMETAMEAFHLLGGWALILIGTLILLSLSEKIWKIQVFTTKSKAEPCPNCSQSQQKKQNFCPACGKLLKYVDIKISKRDMFKIAALLLSASLLTTIQAPVFALTEGPAEVIIQSPGGEQTTAQILPEIKGYVLEFVYRDKEFEEIAQQDATLTYAYTPPGRPQATIWVLLEIAESRSALHPWEVCLITYPQELGRQPEATQLDLRDVQLLQNPPIIGRFFAFKRIRSNITEVVLYWYENALFNTGSGYEQKYAKISLVAYANNPEDIPQTEELLLPVGEALIEHWEPIKSWSRVFLTIAQHGAALIIITTTLLAFALAFQAMKNQKEKKSNLNVYKKLALEEEKLILRAAHQAAQEDKATGNAIASHYQKLAGKPIVLELLLKKLNDAEEAGLTKRGIVSREDEPFLVWKTQMPL